MTGQPDGLMVMTHGVVYHNMPNSIWLGVFVVCHSLSISS